MFRDSFREFESDSFFDFGASPFRQQQQHRWDAGGGPQSRAHQQPNQSGRRPHRNSSDDHRGGALVPAGQWQQQRLQRGYNGGGLPGYTFGMPQFDRLFEGVGQIMADAGGRLRRAQEASGREGFNGQVFCQSSVFAYSSGGSGGGEPQVYQAVSETRAGPGGVRETRKAVKDSRTREEKVAVGHHIGARGHTVERRRNVRTGDQQEDHNYEGIDESEGERFDREWDSRAAGIPGWGRELGHAGHRQHGRLAEDGGSGGGGGTQRAITDGRHN